MRIQILILGFKGLKFDKFLKCIIKRDRKRILKKWSQDWNKHEHNSTSTSTSTRLNFDEPINYTYVSQIDIPLLLLLLAFLLSLRAPCGHVSSVQRQRRSSWRFPYSVRQSEEHSATEVFLALHLPQIIAKISAHTVYYWCQPCG